MYSEDIPKICSLCVFADAAEEDVEEVFCRRRSRSVGAAEEACKHYKYDIFKRRVRRRKPFKTELKPEDLTL